MQAYKKRSFIFSRSLAILTKQKGINAVSGTPTAIEAQREYPWSVVHITLILSYRLVHHAATLIRKFKFKRAFRITHLRDRLEF